MKTNKEVIDALTEYFIKQDPSLIARALAACMIDFNRIKNIKNLPKKEKDCLLNRIEKNVEELLLFIEKGQLEDFKLIKWNSDE